MKYKHGILLIQLKITIYRNAKDLPEIQASFGAYQVKGTQFSDQAFQDAEVQDPKCQPD